MAQRRIRVGIDTGGTFTDVVAFDEDTGVLSTTKTPSTPGNPADGFIAGIEKILGIIGADGADITAVSHGTTVATNKLLEGKVERLGFITTEGYEFMLEIARQSVPDELDKSASDYRSGASRNTRSTEIHARQSRVAQPAGEPRWWPV